MWCGIDQMELSGIDLMSGSYSLFHSSDIHKNHVDVNIKMCLVQPQRNIKKCPVWLDCAAPNLFKWPTAWFSVIPAHFKPKAPIKLGYSLTNSVHQVQLCCNIITIINVYKCSKRIKGILYT